VLTGDLPLIQPSDLEQVFSPPDSEEYDWGALIDKLVGAGDDRLTVFERLVEDRATDKRGLPSPTSTSKSLPTERPLQPTDTRRPRTRERDMIIGHCLERGMIRSDVCRMLDQKGIPTTPKMAKHGLNRWTDAWEDDEFRNNVQQVLTKSWSRWESVKS